MIGIAFGVGWNGHSAAPVLPVAANVSGDGTIELTHTDDVTGDLTYTITHPQWAQTDPNRDGPGVFVVTPAQDDAIQAGTPLVLIDVSIADDNGDPQLNDTATLTPPLVISNAAHTAPVTAYEWQLDTVATGDTGTSVTMGTAGGWRVVATVPATDAGGSAVTSTSNVLTIAAAAAFSVSRVEFSTNATVPSPDHSNKQFWGADADETDNFYNFGLDLSGAAVGDLLLVMAGSRSAITGATLDGTAMTAEIIENGGSYQRYALWKRTLTAGDISADTPLVIEGSEQERAVTAVLVKGGVLQQVAHDALRGATFTLSVTATDARNEVIAFATGEGQAFLGHTMSNVVTQDTLVTDGYHLGIGNIGAAFGTASDVAVGAFSSVYAWPDGEDSIGILVLTEPAP